MYTCLGRGCSVGGRVAGRERWWKVINEVPVGCHGVGRGLAVKETAWGEGESGQGVGKKTKQEFTPSTAVTRFPEFRVFQGTQTDMKWARYTGQGGRGFGTDFIWSRSYVHCNTRAISINELVCNTSSRERVLRSVCGISTNFRVEYRRMCVNCIMRRSILCLVSEEHVYCASFAVKRVHRHLGAETFVKQQQEGG